MPHYWFMNDDEYSESWDKELNSLLDNNKFVYQSEYTAMLGNSLIWVGNYPYSCFQPYYYYQSAKFRPSRSTILKAKKKLDKEVGRVDKYKVYESKLGSFINNYHGN
jgi:hypothetical protein